MFEIETSPLVLLLDAPPSALLPWVVYPNEGSWGGEGEARESARLGLSSGHGGVCPGASAYVPGMMACVLGTYFLGWPGSPHGEGSCGCRDSYKEEQQPGGWATKLKSFLFPTQGTTVRVITAIDQDKGRPRGIGYTIISGKAWVALVPHPDSRRAALGVSGSAGQWRDLWPCGTVA